MKIEIGESLIYTWLRHVKKCQMVQTNWTSSKRWSLKHQSDLQKIKDAVDKLFPNYAIFGRREKASLQQFIAQAEIDVLGSLDLGNKIFAVDVAFHESGLGYGGSVKNAERIIKKSLRAAMCIYGYFDKKDAEIIFITPRMRKKDWPLIDQGIIDLENELRKLGYGFVFRVICDQSKPDFQTEIMDPIIGIINNVSDTNELFVRSVQLLHMYYRCASKATATAPVRTKRVGAIANNDLRSVLVSSSKVTSNDISDLQNKVICKGLFGIDYPVLDKSPIDKNRYYKRAVNIKSIDYYLCSQWYERHRQALENWIITH